jgi:predicted HAD superfamily Cof-like phosphohydrolase
MPIKYKPAGTNQCKVKQFMHTFGQEVQAVPAWPSEAITQLRLELIDEECDELHDGVDRRSLVEVADALTDILYVVYGMGQAFGIDLNECFDEVHRSNMSKLEDGEVIYRSDGKVLKGRDYFSPDLETIITQQGLNHVGHP